MDNLEALANQFKEWRKSRRHHRYPKQFWEEILQLAEYYPICVIAKALNINASYLRQRLRQNQIKLSFAPVTVTMPSVVSIEFTNQNSCFMSVRFQATHGELVNMILSLARDSR
jgi:hypothetical protein